jgi:multidrug efflux pump subunit AcrA (membrane-fusion protein)
MIPLTRRVSTRFLLLAALLGCCLPLGCKAAAPPAEEKAPPATVKWESALQSALEEWLELVGTTSTLPDRAARVTAPVEGQVRSVLTGNGKPVVEGQRVDKGTVLVQLDDTIVRANLAKLEASQETLAEEEKQAQYATELANLEVDRLQKLATSLENPRPPGATSLVSSVEREKAAIALKDAQSKLKGAQGKRAAGTKEVTALREQLRLYTLTAPIGGRVGRMQVVPGQTLAVGTQVAEIIDIDEQIDVLCFVPAAMIGRLRLGQPARAGAVEKDPNAPAEAEAEGQVAYIAEQAEPETGNFAVKVRFSNKEAHVRANRVLRIRVLTKPSRECLSLPEAAVMEDEEPPTVVIVENVKTEKNADGKEETTGVARRLQVELGVRDRILHQVEIVQLSDTEKDPAKKWQGGIKDALFIVEGGAGLQTGDAVKLEVEGD